jgi:hypothetical protein
MSHSNPWQRQLVVGLLPLTLGFGILAAAVFVPRALSGNADFRQFYAGGYIIRSGLRHGLYDPRVQRETENSVVSPSTQVLPMIHPAYEYLFFAPLSLLPYKTAYALWIVVNLLVLAYCGIRIARSINDPWLALALVAGFAPVLATVMHGQDSLWLLLFCLLSLDSTSDFAAGALLGLTAFRFHLLIPVIVLYALWKKWRFLEGALLTSSALAVISVCLVGIKGSLLYLRTAISSTEVRQGFSPNAYGIAQALVGPRHAHIALVIAGACAIAAFWYASRQEPSLDLALLVIPLASYYLMFHDLVFLLIPLSRRIRQSSAAVAQYVIAILGFTPLAYLSAAPSALMLFRQQRHEPMTQLTAEGAGA